ncbi:acyltransferase family protein [Pseudofrankia inefficax]|uniref:Acyltransferase 3 n=1 Tax=Pseudofrankia inefficax (strain DSM 45817 / CECT 9037 / DDB 130130 / EuI1c) TaxID=298654 RepID=E3JAD3_PSEI1|nr:acyltransferase family protein [Pseudofrankia inefficax]ADP80984.1 acyltransferase 3 [Pseudofrankia inefficax]
MTAVDLPAARVRRAAAPVRYHYLDALRAALMFMGVFVHAALGDDRVFRLIAHLSGLFRMNGFFLVSGFFSSMLVLRYGAGLMVRRRLLSIGVPLVAVLVLLNPIARWLMYNQYNPHVGLVDYLLGHRVAHPDGPMTWHLQLWFLVSLLVYTLCSPVVFSALTRLFGTRGFGRVAGSRPRTMTALIAFVLLATLVLQGGYLLALRPVTESTPADYVVDATLRYLPFFIVGMALFLDGQRLLPAFSRPAPVLLVAAGCLLVVAERGLVAPLGTELGDDLVRSVFALAVVANLLAVFQRIVTQERPILRYGADAAYSVYLFHYVTIYALAALLGIGVDAHWPKLLLITMLTFVITLSVHHFLIRRFHVLAVIFNGKFNIGKPGPARAADGRPAFAAGPAPAGPGPGPRPADRDHRTEARPEAREVPHAGSPRGGRHRAPKGPDRRLAGR